MPRTTIRSFPCKPRLLKLGYQEEEFYVEGVADAYSGQGTSLCNGNAQIPAVRTRLKLA